MDNDNSGYGAACAEVPRLVVVGNGMAGARLVQELLALVPNRYHITVFGEEPHGNYDRIQLSPVLAGEKAVADIMLNDHGWYRANGVEFHPGVRVAAIDLAGRALRTAGGKVVDYDRLVLATGSTPYCPDVPGMALAGVVGYRAIADVERMLAASRTQDRAVVIGGGLLGLEAACGLRAQGMAVTVVHRAEYLMNRQLDREAGLLLQRELEGRGIAFRLGSRTRELVGARRVCAVRLHGGEEIAAGLVVLAAGIRPSVDLARSAGLACEQGIVVDDHLQTSHPGVYAVGECVQHRGRCYGLVAPVYEQARVLARHLAGDSAAAYAGSVTATRLKVTGIDVFAAGDFSGGAGCEALVYRDPARRVYRKLVLDGERLAGVVACGEVAEAGWYFRLLQAGTPAGRFREALLFGEAACTEPAVEPLGQAIPPAAAPALRSGAR